MKDVYAMKKEKFCFDIFTALIILIIAATLIFFISMSYIPTDLLPSTFNSNAKLVFTNTAVILTKADAKGYTVPDGIYSGSLITENAPKNKSIDELEEKYWDTDMLVDICLKMLMGIDSASAGYYCVVIADSLPVRAYWSQTDTAAVYCRELGLSAVKELDKKGTIDGCKFGSYPIENYGADKIKFDFSEAELSALPLYSSYEPKKSLFGHGSMLHKNYLFDPTLFTVFPYCLILPAEIILLAARIYFVRKKHSLPKE